MVDFIALCCGILAGHVFFGTPLAAAKAMIIGAAMMQALHYMQSRISGK